MQDYSRSAGRSAQCARDRPCIFINAPPSCAKNIAHAADSSASSWWFVMATRGGYGRMVECDHLNWPRLAWFSSRILAPPGW